MSETGTPNTEQQEIYVTIWAKAVETQMHFNEMSVKSRQFGLAFVAAALGLAIVLLSQGKEFSIPVSIQVGLSFDLHATVLIILASVFALIGVRILDLNVYHRMLRGAVSFGEDFEERYMKQIFSLQKGMTQAVSHFSRYSDAAVSRENGLYSYTGETKVNAEQKIKRFYNFCIFVLISAAAVIFLLTANFGASRTKEATPTGRSLAPSAEPAPPAAPPTPTLTIPDQPRSQAAPSPKDT
ncbi:MAG: hypothetical protein ABL996_18805 [Micropepsaceae bacterium]